MENQQGMYPPWRLTRLGSFIAGYRVSRIVQQFSAAGDPIRTTSVYDWLTCRTKPDFDRACRLVEISDGEISLDDIREHRIIMRRR